MAAPSAQGDKTETSEWQRRRFASGALRVAVTLVPIATSVEVSLLVSRTLPSTSSTVTAIGRILLIAICSLLALALTDAVARKFLPLAALLQLSLVFPDQTPSRFRTALKGGSGRRLAREVVTARSQGLSDDPSRAAEQLLMLATAIGDHDRRTRGHSERVRLYTDLIAEELHLSHDERARLQWAALIHDIGKITVPAEILNKKGPPDEREWAILKRHPQAGAQLAAPVEPWLGDAVHAIGGHHERWDGSGYPNGLAGDAIPRSAAIVAVADAFEVMTAVRSYKKALPLTEARTELTRCAGTHFSPEVVRALLNVSIGELRRSMGAFAVLAHLPFLGQIAKAASFAPDTVSTAAGLTTTTATAGVTVLALSGGLAIASTASPTPVVPRASMISAEVIQQPPALELEIVPSTTSIPDEIESEQPATSAPPIGRSPLPQPQFNVETPTVASTSAAPLPEAQTEPPSAPQADVAVVPPPPEQLELPPSDAPLIEPTPTEEESSKHGDGSGDTKASKTGSHERTEHSNKGDSSSSKRSGHSSKDKRDKHG